MNRSLFFFCIILFISSNLFSQAPPLQVSPVVAWEKQYGNGNGVYDAIINPDGTIIAVGRSGSNAWVIKLDTAGNSLWQKTIGGTATDYLTMVLPAGDGNYICFGITGSTDGDLSGNTAQGSWVLKINPNGDILWSKTYTGGVYDLLLGPATMYCLGTVLDDGSIALIVSSGPQSVLKLDAGGNVVWRSPPNNLTGKYIIETNDHKLLTSTGLMFDPVTGDTSRFPNFPASPYTEEYPPKDVVALKKINGTIWLAINETVISNKVGYYDEASGNFVLQHWSSSSVTPGADNYVVNGNGFDVLAGNSFILGGYAELYGSGPFPLLGHRPFYNIGGFGKTTFGDLNSGFFYVVKAFPGGDQFLCAGKSSNGSFWFRKYTMLNSIRGSVFFDNNNNNIRDNGELLVSNFSIKSSGPGIEVINKPFGGYFSNNVDTGTYTTSVVLDGLPAFSNSPVSKTSVFASYKNTDSVNFAIHGTAGVRDYSVSLVALAPARPMFTVAYKITYANKGTDTLLNRQLFFIKDSRFQLESTSPLINTASGDTIFWDINNVKPFEEGEIIVNMTVGSPSNPVAIGATLTSSAYIDSTGDTSISDNSSRQCQVVTGSFDPNDKAEAHGNTLSKLEMQNGNHLHYTIRFQNTGNDTAFNIFIRDTLDTKLDWPTIEMVSASHPYQLKVKDGKYMEWKFNNILLVDSFRNEPASHGYITYRIKPKTNLVLGDIINNSASIYFDFNAPVKTNIQSNEVIKTTAIWTGASSTAWEDLNNWDVKVVPDGETVVIVPANVPHYPVVNSSVTCFVLKVDANANITVNAGFNLEVTGK